MHICAQETLESLEADGGGPTLPGGVGGVTAVMVPPSRQTKKPVGWGGFPQSYHDVFWQFYGPRVEQKISQKKPEYLKPRVLKFLNRWTVVMGYRAEVTDSWDEAVRVALSHHGSL